MKKLYIVGITALIAGHSFLDAEYYDNRNAQRRRCIGMVVTGAIASSVGIWGAIKIYEAWTKQGDGEKPSGTGERRKKKYPTALLFSDAQRNIKNAQEIFKDEIVLRITIACDGSSITLRGLRDEESGGKSLTLNHSFALMDLPDFETRNLIFDIPYEGNIDKVPDYLERIGVKYQHITKSVNHIIVATDDLHNTTLNKAGSVDLKNFDKDATFTVCSYAKAQHLFNTSSDVLPGKRKVLIFIRSNSVSDV